MSQAETRTDPGTEDQPPVQVTVPAPRPAADDLIEALPAPAEPASTEPALAEPAPAEPALAEPALAEPALAEPAPVRRRRTGLWAGLLAVTLYIELRLICLLVTMSFADARHIDLWDLLGKYDAGWYSQIANHGYDPFLKLAPDYGLAVTNLAFFPLFPGLMALLDPILPAGAGTAGIWIAWMSGAAAAAGLYKIGSHLRNRPTGVMLAAVWAVIPHALVESMAYSESLFTALAAWSLYALLRRRWLLAGPLCLLAGLTRPTAAALILVVCLSALIAIVRRRDGWRPWVAGVTAPLGFLGYFWWVGNRLGRWDGYFIVQDDAWGLRYDNGAYSMENIRLLLTESGPMALWMVTIVLLAALALIAVLIVDRWPWQLWLYGLVFFAMTFFGDGYFNSKARYMVPAF
ncbi:hypothetical protein AB0M20_35995, partial [Actinoplanes sp. NPDC051633]|uniref:hypothetical protein n=1 Tax=Actinoplanes sp. NPDC051633 TaxID=3155670 RepID=UPI00342D8A53